VLDGFSDRARAVVAAANVEARGLGHDHVGTEHLLLGLLADRDGASSAVLREAGATLAAARHKVAEVGAPLELGAAGGGGGARSGGDGEAPGDLELTARAQRALDRAGRFARHDRAARVGTDHVLLGVLDVEGLGCQVLRGLGVDVAQLREAVTEARAGTTTPPLPDDAVPESPAAERVAPVCPSCGAELDGALQARLLHPHLETGTATRVLVLYCSECGTALGCLPP
jgi:ATP-dependent Clp protease ATP-binding subunit ClpC